MKRVFLGILLSLILVFRVSAQFDGLFSNYMYNLCVVNPAYTGEQTLMQVSMLQRTQWAGFKGAPITSMLSVDMPFKIGKAQQGAGIQFLSDVFGFFNNQQVNLLYSSKFKIKEGRLSVGANVGFLNVICDVKGGNKSDLGTGGTPGGGNNSDNKGRREEIRDVDSEYHTNHSDDNAVPQSRESGVGFDLGFGIQYLAKNWRVGLSATHLTSPKIGLGEKAIFTVKPFYQLHGGIDFALKNPDLSLTADLLVATDLVVGTINVSLRMDIKYKYWAGVGVRMADNMLFNEVAFMGGIKILDGLRLGYTLALPTNGIIAKSYGTHEIFASYEFALVREKSRAFKSLRIL